MILPPRIAGLLVVLGVAALSGAGLESAPEAGSISADDLRRDVFALASDDMGGRLVGTGGNKKAGDFIVDRFAELGLKPVAEDGTYRHRFELIIPRLGTNNALTVTVENEPERYSVGSDFYPERFSGTGQAEGPVVFVGFGISAPALDHDDYDAVDVTGRIVMVLDHEPGERDPESPFDGETPSEHSRSVRKALEAQRRGAAGVILVSDAHNHPNPRSVQQRMRDTWPRGPRRVPPYQLGAWVSDLRIPVIRMAADDAARLVIEDGSSFESVSRRAEAGERSVPIERDSVRVEMTTTVHRVRVPEHNVVALVEGADPVLRDEWIIVCAHYDHEGTTSRGIFNGADDDASGVAGLLEIAEAYVLAAHQGQRPKRSILFAAWNAEEQGLLGAWAYVERPLTPLSQTVAVINMDMIGRDEEVPENGGVRFRGLEPQTAESNTNAVNLLGYSFSADLQAAAEAANLDSALDLRFRYDDSASNLVRRSDQWPFLFEGVPALFVHTGLHPDYHTERDQPEKLNYDKMSRVVQLVHQLSWDLAQSPVRPAFN